MESYEQLPTLDDVPARPRPTRALTVLQQQLLADGAECWRCPLGRGNAPGRPVPTSWDYRKGLPKLALVGEMPGKREVQRGQNFVGPSGKLLDTAAQAGGVPRRDIAILNAASCGPVASGADSIKERTLAACRPRMLTELRRLNPNVILSVGALALRAVDPDVPSGPTALRGALVDISHDELTQQGRKPTLIPTFHPAHILRGGDADAPDAPGSDGGNAADLLYYFFLYDLSKAWRLANGLIQPWRDECDLFIVNGGKLHRATVDAPSGEPVVGDEATEQEFVAAMELIYQEAKELGAFAVDVETDAKDSLEANLTAISFATAYGAVSATWASFQRVPAALEIARQLLADPTIDKWLQNRIYDCIVLPRHKLPVAHPIHDTLLQHHAAFPGLPHRLDQIAQQLLAVRAWKAEYRRSTKNDPELVLYNARDSQGTILIPPHLWTVIKARKTEKVYECDRQSVAIAQRMREMGFWIDLKERARQSKIQHARLDYMRASLEQDFAAIEEEWRDRLARNLAIRQRKKDPDDFMARVALRWDQIAKRKKKPTDVGLLKTKAKADLVALFEVLKIPFSGYTEKGSPITDKKAMEAASARHPLMRQLIHIREAQHVLATYIDGLPIKPSTGRVHPDWSVIKIVGRWSAGKSQNIPKQVNSWPPEEEVDPDYLPPLPGDEELISLLPSAPRPGYRWKRKKSGDYVARTENCKALITAPTVEELMEHAQAVPAILDDPRYRSIYARAREGVGRILFGADFSQLHLRIVALLGKDKFLLDAYANDRDVHAINAATCFPKKFPQLVVDFDALVAQERLKERFGKVSMKTDWTTFALPKADAKDALEAPLREKLLKLSKPWAALRDLAKRIVYAWIYRGRPESAYQSIIQVFPEVELSAIAEGFRLLDEKLVGWVSWCNRNEGIVRAAREVRESMHGRVRLFPLGNYNITIAVNFPVIGFETALMARSLFRLCSLTIPDVLEIEKLYAFGLLDREWVEAHRALGYGSWKGSIFPIINGHDAIDGECDAEDGDKAQKFLLDCMDHTITLDGATMRFFGEGKIGRRLSET